MNSKNLMLGNYIGYRFIIGKVTAIIKNKIYINAKFGDVRSEFSININNCRPLPITDEFLRNNDFIFDEIGGDWMGNNLIIFGRKAPYMVNGIEINYIHELQNIAHLLGFDLRDLKF